MYRIVTQSAVRKDIRKLDVHLQQIIEQEHFPKIKSNPYQANQLHYEFKGLWSYHFTHKGGEYRIIYEIYPENEIILVIMISRYCQK